MLKYIEYKVTVYRPGCRKKFFSGSFWGIRPEKDCRACARGQSRDKKKGWSYEPYNINGTAPFSACAGMVLQNLQNGGGYGG